MNETYRSYESYKFHLRPFQGKIMSHLVLTGAGGRAGSAAGCAFRRLITSLTARSSCGSLPSMTDLGSFSTSMSGSTPWPSITHSPLVLTKPNSGTNTEPPSINEPRSVIPTTPPHERLPMSGPSPDSRNMAGKMSPSDAEFSFNRQAMGPMKTPSG